MIRRPPRSTLSSSSAASDVYKRQLVHYPIIMEQLAGLIGCKLSLFKTFFTDHSLWKTLWFGALQPSVYRLTGPGASPTLAKQTLDRLPVAWFTNDRSSGMARKLLACNLLSFICTPFGLLESSW
eukprot:TRINITY_DN33670_c0_g1_i1.p3 TRINITY_DN33670_c0_g1~~TRINITY_DN33670_c0_g1_i1.p3  ORF type:complete len:125 (+),score=20.38 TRINITY_DN33670_c0_g1_i1:52-426(+)